MRTAFESLRVYQLSEKLADQVWEIALGWDKFAKDTVGKQMVRSVDSIGANIAEGSGRGSFQDNRRFIRTARASLNENPTLAAACVPPETIDASPSQNVEANY